MNLLLFFFSYIFFILPIGGVYTMIPRSFVCLLINLFAFPSYIIPYIYTYVYICLFVFFYFFLFVHFNRMKYVCIYVYMYIIKTFCIFVSILKRLFVSLFFLFVNLLYLSSFLINECGGDSKHMVTQCRYMILVKSIFVQDQY